MNHTKFHTQIDDLEQSLRDKLGVRGKTLKACLRRSGRRIPRYLRRAGKVLTDTQDRLSHPKLSRMIDTAKVDTAFKDFQRYLNALSPSERRKDAFVSWLGTLTANLLIAGFLAVLILLWIGIL